MLPQQLALPPARTAHEKALVWPSPPPVTLETLAIAGETGIAPFPPSNPASTIVPAPSSPEKLLPQQRAVPSARRTHVCAAPTPSSVTHGVAVHDGPASTGAESWSMTVASTAASDGGTATSGGAATTSGFTSASGAVLGPPPSELDPHPDGKARTSSDANANANEKMTPHMVAFAIIRLRNPPIQKKPIGSTLP